MATWHQLQRPVQLWHETEWTVVVDPPGEHRSLVLFHTQEAAEEYCRKVEHSYVLKPRRTSDAS